MTPVRWRTALGLRGGMLAAVGVAQSESGRTRTASVKPFAGTWYWHGEGVSIEPDGSGRAGWRTYRRCSEEPPPCDVERGHELISGGRAEFVVMRVRRDTAWVRVIHSTDPSRLAVGTLTIRLAPGDHLAFP